MKCPLIQATITAVDVVLPSPLADCLNEECAWWSAPGKCCALLRLNTILALIEHNLRDIASKTPLGGTR
jgi:hypothetical protein